uniref:substrate-binding domain-containing protein n=1 Tax=Pseudonocardia pini TaxID=2758030 RepID=UPI0015F07362
ERLLGGHRLPTALFAMSDEMALGALRTLRRAGVDVPGRMSVVGFDDQSVAEYADLTTIAQPAREQGERAAALLLEALDGTLRGTPDLDLPTRLVVRSTTGPPAR